MSDHAALSQNHAQTCQFCGLSQLFHVLFLGHRIQLFHVLFLGHRLDRQDGSLRSVILVLMTVGQRVRVGDLVKRKEASEATFIDCVMIWVLFRVKHFICVFSGRNLQKLFDVRRESWISC